MSNLTEKENLTPSDQLTESNETITLKRMHKRHRDYTKKVTHVSADGEIKYKKIKHKHHRKKRMSTKKKILLGIVIVLFSIILVIGSTFLIMRYLGKKEFLKRNQAAKIRTFKDTYSYDDGHVVYYNGKKYVYNENMVSVVFLGIDRSKLGTEEIGNAGQADAIYILSYDSKTGKAYVIPVSRETMTDVRLYTVSGQSAGIKKLQLCLAYGYGNGKDTSCENTLASLSDIFYNIPFHTYMALNWDGIGPLNDLSGGVSLTSLEDVETQYSNITKGTQVTLLGNDAWSYVKYRNISKLESNNDRLERQKQYLNAYMSQMIPKVRSDFSMISKLYNTAGKYTYTNFSYNQVVFSASTILPDVYSNKDIEFVSIKGTIKQGKENAEFYPDEKSLYETILKVFYNEEQE
ncbi:MAG: LCP family protein [Eubacterium sp.]|nr:LCP family protein [Eubacterium sp.]